MTAVDLHLHSTFSDGVLTPAQLVCLCAGRGLAVISITDHDSVGGVPEAIEAARSFPELTVIPGVEMSTEAPEAEVHVLGYFVDHLDGHLQSTLRRLREGREIRCRKMVEKLNELGIMISWDRVRELSAGAAVGRPHIAQAMVEAGYVAYPRDAFERYLGRDGPAYAERAKLAPVDAVRMLVDNGASPVLAHPTFSTTMSDEKEMATMRRTLEELKAAGLVGVEVYYGEHSPERIRCLSELAAAYGLVPCGGSDYHGSGNPGEPEPGTVGPPMQTVDSLESIRRRAAATHS